MYFGRGGPPGGMPMARAPPGMASGAPAPSLPTGPAPGNGMMGGPARYGGMPPDMNHMGSMGMDGGVQDPHSSYLRSNSSAGRGQPMRGVPGMGSRMPRGDYSSPGMPPQHNPHAQGAAAAAAQHGQNAGPMGMRQKGQAMGFYLAQQQQQQQQQQQAAAAAAAAQAGQHAVSGAGTATRTVPFDINSDFPSLSAASGRGPPPRASDKPGDGNDGFGGYMDPRFPASGPGGVSHMSTVDASSGVAASAPAPAPASAEFNFSHEHFPALPGSAGRSGGGVGPGSAAAAGAGGSMGDYHRSSGTGSSALNAGSAALHYGGGASSMGLDRSRAVGGAVGLGMHSSSGGGLGSVTSAMAAGTASTTANANASTAGGGAGGAAGAAAGKGGAEHFGLLGLLNVIRMTDRDLNTLALGLDLTTLGLNLNSPEVLYATFASPWADKPTTKDPLYTLPQCYYMQPPTLKTGHLNEFKLETLFYIFYAMPRDSLQAYAAQELYKRDWRYHQEHRLWFTRQQDGKSGGVQYIYFDINAWDRRVFTGNLNASQFLAESEVQVKI